MLSLAVAGLVSLTACSSEDKNTQNSGDSVATEKTVEAPKPVEKEYSKEDYRNAGFDAKVARELRMYKVDPKEATAIFEYAKHAPSNVVYDTDTLLTFCDNGIKTLDSFKKWDSAVGSKSWSIQLFDLGINDADIFLKWKEAGIGAPSVIANFKNAGCVSPEDAKIFVKDLNFDDTQVKRWTDTGITSASEIKQLVSKRVHPDFVKEWIAIGITDIDTMIQWDAELKEEFIKEYPVLLELKLTPEDFHKWRVDSPVAIKKWIAKGYNFDDMPDWAFGNPDAVEAKK